MEGSGACGGREGCAGAQQSLNEPTREAIDKGATTVEDIHRSIADLPLEVLERSHLLERPAREVRRVHDVSTGALFDLVRDIDEKVGGVATELLAEAHARRAGGHAQHGEHASPHER